MTTLVAQRGRFAQIVLRAMGRMNLTQTDFCHRIDVPDRTVRNWLNENRSPAIDWLLFNAHRLPPELVRDILQELAGTRFVIDIIPDPAAGCIVASAHAASVGAATLVAELHAAKADNVIDAGEAGRLLRRAWAVAAELKVITVELTLVLGKQAARGLTRRTA